MSNLIYTSEKKPQLRNKVDYEGTKARNAINRDQYCTTVYGANEVSSCRAK
jgi:hypothetical protein